MNTRKASTISMAGLIAMMMSTPFAGQASPGDSGKLKVGTDTNWQYVIIDENNARLCRNCSTTNQNERIGKIPWSTNNPGNLTVGDAALDKVIIDAGGYEKAGKPKYFKPLRKYKYAIFLSTGRGKTATKNWLLRFKGKSVDSALKAYLKEKDSKTNEAYSKFIRGEVEKILRHYYNQMSPPMGIPIPGLSPNQLAATVVNIVWSTDISLVDSMSIVHQSVNQLSTPSAWKPYGWSGPKPAKEPGTMMDAILEGMFTKEGSTAPKGIAYNCSTGYTDMESRRSKGDRKLIKKLKKDAGAEKTLRAALNCK